MGTTEKIPVNNKVDRERFISPFSRSLIEKVEWQELKRNWPGTASTVRLIRNEEYDLLNCLNKVEVMSGLQIAKNFLAGIGNFGKRKRRLKVLARHGVLVEHRLKVSGREPCLIYTLGPVGAGAVDVPYISNWWLDVENHFAMERLIAVQLWLRLRVFDIRSTFLPGPEPLQGQIEFLGKKYLVLVVGNRLKLNEDSWYPLFVVGEDLKQAASFVFQLPFNQRVRFTTDYDLFAMELYQMFYAYMETGELANEEIAELKKG